MEDGRWLRMITAGLIIAAIVVSFFLLTGRFNGGQRSQVARVSPSPTIESLPTPSPSPDSLGLATDSGTLQPGQTLPKTGLPLVLLGAFSVAAVISGYFLRKYPE